MGFSLHHRAAFPLPHCPCISPMIVEARAWSPTIWDALLANFSVDVVSYLFSMRMYPRTALNDTLTRPPAAVFLELVALHRVSRP